MRAAIIFVLALGCGAEGMLDDDAGIDAGGDARVVVTGPVVYTPDRTQSPITPAIAERLREIAATDPSLAPDVFAKVGASNTVYFHFLQCFAGANVDLDGRPLDETVAWFLGGDAAGTDPYRRESLAATVGWSAWSALSGDPPPIDQEIEAIRPRYAVILFGTNDVEARNIYRYADNMLDLTDRLLARGIIPLLTTIPARNDDPADDAWVPPYNAVVRGVAQARQVPFIDLHRALAPLPNRGLGGDGVHLNVYVPPEGARACVFTPAGLMYGFNTRNLLTIEALDRVRRVLDGGGAPDPEPVALRRGAGTTGDPVVVDGFPFTDLRDTTVDGESLIDAYPGCAATQDESGPEVVYRLELDRPTTLRMMVFDRGSVDVDLHLLGATVAGDACVMRHDQLLVVTLPAGTHHLVLDTFVASGTPAPGEYLLVLVDEG